MSDQQPSLSNAQKASLGSLKHVAGLALLESGHRTVRVGEPEIMHPGMDYSAVLVKVESWDPIIKDSADPTRMQRSEVTFLIEPGGCVARVLT